MGNGTDIQIILLWVGLFITFILGLVNFLWGPAILMHREKVKIVNPKIYALFLPEETRETTRAGEIITLKKAVLSIEASCELVLTNGINNLDVKEVEIVLNKQTCHNLRDYFELRSSNTYSLLPTDFPPQLPLEPKVPVPYNEKYQIDCTDRFEKQHIKTNTNTYPYFIQTYLDKLETKYEICWTRYDGKRLCWKFPDRWWKNLGKKLWG